MLCWVLFHRRSLTNIVRALPEKLYAANGSSVEQMHWIDIEKECEDRFVKTGGLDIGADDCVVSRDVSLASLKHAAPIYKWSQKEHAPGCVYGLLSSSFLLQGPSNNTKIVLYLMKMDKARDKWVRHRVAD